MHNQPFVKWMSAQLPDVYILPKLSFRWSNQHELSEFFLHFDDRFGGDESSFVNPLMNLRNEVKVQVKAGVRTFVIPVAFQYPGELDGHIFNIHVHLNREGTSIENLYSLDTGIIFGIHPKNFPQIFGKSSWKEWGKKKVFGQSKSRKSFPLWRQEFERIVEAEAHQFHLLIVLSTIALFLFEDVFYVDIPQYFTDSFNICVKPPPERLNILIRPSTTTVTPFSVILRDTPKKMLSLSKILDAINIMPFGQDTYKTLEQKELLHKTLCRLFENNWNMWRAVQGERFIQEGEDVGFCNTWTYFLSYMVLKCKVPLNELFPRVMAIQQPYRESMIRKWRNEALNPSAEIRFGEPEEYRTMVTQLNSALTDMGFPPNDNIKTRFQDALQETKNERNNVQTLQSQNPGISFDKEMSTYQQRLRDLEILFAEFQEKDKVKKLLFDTKVKPFDLCSLDAAERESEVVEEKKEFEAFEQERKRRRIEALDEGYAGDIGGGFFFLL